MNSLTVLAAALAATALPLPALAAPPTTMAEHVAATRFDVEVTGSGPDLVLIPGLSSSRDVWDETVAAFADSYRVHTVEVGGFGHDAGPNASGEVLPGLVEELSDYLATLDAPTVVGHSMGGFTGLKIALDHPEAVGKLVIVDSLPFFSVLMDPDATVASATPQAEQMRAMMTAMADGETPEADCAHPSMQARGMSNTPEGQCRVDRISHGADRKVVAQVMYEIMTTDLRAKLPSLSVPTTMLYPYDPPMATEAMAASLYGTAYGDIAAVKLVPVAGSRHFIMFDQPQKFRAALDQVLAD